MFHKHQHRKKVDETANLEVLQYNKEHNISHTPWGIAKQAEN